MSDAKLIGKLLRVPRLVWQRRFDAVARMLAAERFVRIVGVVRVYRVARWIGLRRVARWAMAHRVPEETTSVGEVAPATRSRRLASGNGTGRRSKKAA